jgi:BirA family transcriptional regulator, biotin operon repressor / biotin---[acetyl-CoA-carboxylase] ligase
VTSEPEIVRLARVGSTMDALHDLAEAGAPTGTAVVADVQESGRGSRGRSWTSPRGGLWLTVLARPVEATLGLLSLRVGLAVAGVVRPLVGGDALRLKWPNDLMLGDRKTGGILCEARWHGASPAWAAIGVGLNVANPPSPTLTEIATHLAAARPDLAPEQLVEPVVRAIRGVDLETTALSSSELAELGRLDWLRGRPLVAPEPGVADGVEHDGALRVRRHDGTITLLRAGTVVLAETGATADLRTCS